MKRRVVLVVTNDLVTDWRIHKMGLTLHKGGYEVTLIGVQKKESLPLPPLPYRIHRIPVRFSRGKLFYLEFTMKLLFYLLFHSSFHIYVANDLDTLLPIFLAAKWKGNKPIVYDAHEYFVGMVDLLNKPITRKLWESMEKLLLPKVPYRITVTEGTKRLYESRYKGDWLVIKNYPLREWAEPPSPLSSPPSRWILIYHGVIKKGRFLDEIVETFFFLPHEHFVLWIIGYGPYLPQLKQKIELLPFKEQIICYGPVPHVQLKEYLKRAHIGLSFLNLNAPNYQESLPTKVLDYMAFGIPFLSTPIPLLSNILQEKPAGILVSSPHPETIAHHIQELTTNLCLYNTLRTNGIELIQKELNWESQEPTLLAFYNQIQTPCQKSK